MLSEFVWPLAFVIVAMAVCYLVNKAIGLKFGASKEDSYKVAEDIIKTLEFVNGTLESHQKQIGELKNELSTVKSALALKRSFVKTE